ncbi:MAG: DUF1028 domain-containing protein [Bdellovibrionales bacterium]|nr:DUF1028 domain-containing protein [Bdellovibrionales bacterium]
MKHLFAVALVSFAFTSAHATIYLVDTDAKTHDIGMAVISSGPVVTYKPSPMTGIKGVGFVGWSGNAANVNPELDKKVFAMMKASSSAHDIEAVVDQKIHGWYSRYMFVSYQGVVGHVFPPRGCAQPECGVQYGKDNGFIVMGGGLEPNVVQKTADAFERVHTMDIPLECKLLLGVQTIINVGGEVEEFKEARISTDGPNLTEQSNFTSVVGEAKVVEDFRAKMAMKGLKCPATRNARHESDAAAIERVQFKKKLTPGVIDL